MNSKGSLQVEETIDAEAKSDMWSLGCILYATQLVLVLYSSCCSSSNEFGLLRKPFRAEDMEGLYRILILMFIILGLQEQDPRCPQHDVCCC